MEAGIIDHLLALLLIVVMPIKGMRDFDGLLMQLQANAPAARPRTYRRILLWEWAVVTLVVVAWGAAGRPWSALGLDSAWGLRSLLGWGVTAVVVVLLALQTRMVLRDPQAMDSFRREISALRAVIPHNRRESNLWVLLSLTAGICEELLFRGFLLAYFTSLVGLWAAVLLSSMVFGLGHAYQGGRGVLKTGGIGLLMAILFVLTGGLWAPMLLHAIIDLNSGYLGRRALQGWEAPAQVISPT